MNQDDSCLCGLTPYDKQWEAHHGRDFPDAARAGLFTENWGGSCWNDRDAGEDRATPQPRRGDKRAVGPLSAASLHRTRAAVGKFTEIYYLNFLN